MCFPSPGWSWSGSVITVGSVIGSPWHLAREANEEADASHSSVPLPHKSFPRPTHSLTPQPMASDPLSPALFFPVSTVAPQPFPSSNERFIPFFGILTSAAPTSLRMPPFLIFLAPDVLGKTRFPHKPQPCSVPTAAARPRSLLPARTHAPSKRGFLIHSNKAFGLGIYKIGAKRKQWGEILWQRDQNSLL